MSAQAHPASYYVATARGMKARPRLKGEASCDVCVVGGGFSGASAALHLAERGYRVILLEANRVGWGASGRNGGQIHSGLRPGARGLVDRFGPDRARRLWELGEEAKAIVRERIARHAIECDYREGLLIAASRPAHATELEREVACLREVFNYRQASVVTREEAARLVATDGYHGGMLDRGGGHLHPLNYALGLARAAEAAGAQVFEDSRVVALTEPGRPRLRTELGEVRARHVVLCCNGYLDRLEPRLAGGIMPIHNYILATEPLGEAGARALLAEDIAVCDTRFVVNYYRFSADHRLLFGGGETYSRHERRDVKAFARRHLLRVFPQLGGTRLDYGWGGRLAITRNRLPHFGRLGANLYFAQGFSGQGVALTSLAGKLIAEAVAGTAERFDVFAALPHSDFPGGPSLRHPLRVLGMLYYALRDRL